MNMKVFTRQFEKSHVTKKYLGEFRELCIEIDGEMFVIERTNPACLRITSSESILHFVAPAMNQILMRKGDSGDNENK